MWILLSLNAASTILSNKICSALSFWRWLQNKTNKKRSSSKIRTSVLTALTRSLHTHFNCCSPFTPKRHLGEVIAFVRGVTVLLAAQATIHSWQWKFPVWGIDRYKLNDNMTSIKSTEILTSIYIFFHTFGSSLTFLFLLAHWNGFEWKHPLDSTRSLGRPQASKHSRRKER